MYKHIPNIITATRLIASLPLAAIAFVANKSPQIHLAITLAVILLTISDTLDGQLARRWKCTSKFGEKWDPIADKLAITLFIPLVFFKMIGIFPVIIIVLRDALSSILRLAVNQAVPARLSGKIKTVVNLSFMCLLFAAIPVENGYLERLSKLQPNLYWISGISISVVCLWSGWDYIKALCLNQK